MSTRATLLAAVIAVSPLLHTADAAPVSSTISLQADSDAGLGVVTHTDVDSQGATTNPLSASVSATATNGAEFVTTSGAATASWSAPGAGTVNFDDFGWMTMTTSGSAVLFNGLDWSYTFVADANGFFALDWVISTDPATTSPFGLNGVSFLWSEVGGNQFLDLDTAGSLSRAVISGQQYTATLRNSANIFGGLGTRTAYMDASFEWSAPINAVPEPTSMALFGLTALGFGVGFRRRRGGEAIEESA